MASNNMDLSRLSFNSNVRQMLEEQDMKSKDVAKDAAKGRSVDWPGTSFRDWVSQIFNLIV